MKTIKLVAFEKKEKTNCFIALELLFHPVILILNFLVLIYFKYFKSFFMINFLVPYLIFQNLLRNYLAKQYYLQTKFMQSFTQYFDEFLIYFPKFKFQANFQYFYFLLFYLK